MKKFSALILAVLMLAMYFAGCSKSKESVVIYSCANDQRIAFMTESLQAKFPDYDIVVEYMGTSKLAAKLLAEGVNTDCDIVHDLSYLNLDSLNNAKILADLGYVDTSAYLDDTIVSKHLELQDQLSLLALRAVLRKHRELARRGRKVSVSEATASALTENEFAVGAHIEDYLAALGILNKRTLRNGDNDICPALAVHLTGHTVRAVLGNKLSFISFSCTLGKI